MPKKKFFAVFITAVLSIFIIAMIAKQLNIFPSKTYTANDFNITTIKSSVDFNENGIDDYTDILLGAIADAQNHPQYDSRYWDTGYPPDNIGVCTDVIWRAFKNAGYCLRYMVDKDIRSRPEAYPNIKTPDDKIDFRRVKNLNVFFDKYAVSLTVDPYDISAWQPGDIVVFNEFKHIGIVSDKRDKNGLPYIIHNAGQANREEPLSSILRSKDTVLSKHWRFDASRIDKSMCIKMD